MADEWVPFGLDENERAIYAVLVDGIPEWMEEALLAWAVSALPANGMYPYAETLRRIQNECRIPTGVSATESLLNRQTVTKWLGHLPEGLVLRVVDWLLSKSYGSALALDAVLQAGSSKWTVGDRLGKPGLVERVPEGVQVAVEDTIASTGRAGELLARAWADVHGIEPKPSSAYAYAVRAVEAAAIPVVQPKKKDATLGTVLGQMKADGDWRLPLREHADAPGPEMLLSMIRTLWFGHRDRHGSPDPDYSDVTQDEARAAVMLAATLVEWLASGAVARRP